MANGVAAGEATGLANGRGWRRSVSRGAGALLVLAAGAGVLAVAKGLPGTSQAGRAVEVEFVARDLKFNERNPRLELQVGETLRLVLRNAEPGPIPHDLVITGPQGMLSQRLGPGESQVLTFAPTQPGIYHYSCSLHPRLMDGEIVVKP